MFLTILSLSLTFTLITALPSVIRDTLIPTSFSSASVPTTVPTTNPNDPCGPTTDSSTVTASNTCGAVTAAAPGKPEDTYTVTCQNDGSGEQITWAACSGSIQNLCGMLDAHGTTAGEWNWAVAPAGNCAVGIFIPPVSFGAENATPDGTRCHDGIFEPMASICLSQTGIFSANPNNVGSVNLLHLPDEKGTGQAADEDYPSYIMMAGQPFGYGVVATKGGA